MYLGGKPLGTSAANVDSLSAANSTPNPPDHTRTDPLHKPLSTLRKSFIEKCAYGSDDTVFSTQGVNRIHICGTQRWDKGGHYVHHSEEHCGASESHRGPWLQAKEQRAGRTARQEGKRGSRD